MFHLVFCVGSENHTKIGQPGCGPDALDTGAVLARAALHGYVVSFDNNHATFRTRF